MNLNERLAAYHKQRTPPKNLELTPRQRRRARHKQNRTLREGGR